MALECAQHIAFRCVRQRVILGVRTRGHRERRRHVAKPPAMTAIGTPSMSIGCAAAARARSIGLNFAGPATAIYGFSLTFCGFGRRMLASMSGIDPRAATPLLNWSDSRAVGLQ